MRGSESCWGGAQGKINKIAAHNRDSEQVFSKQRSLTRGEVFQEEAEDEGWMAQGVTKWEVWDGVGKQRWRLAHLGTLWDESHNNVGVGENLAAMLRE